MIEITKLTKEMKTINLISSIIAVVGVIVTCILYREGITLGWQLCGILSILALNLAANSNGYVLGMNTYHKLMEVEKVRNKNNG